MVDKNRHYYILLIFFYLTSNCLMANNLTKNKEKTMGNNLKELYGDIVKSKTFKDQQLELWNLLSTGGDPVNKKVTAMGTKSIPVLWTSLHSVSEDYLLNAVEGVNFLQEPDRSKILSYLLGHEDINVVDRAIRNLNESYDKNIRGDLIKSLNIVSDGYIRGMLAVLLAKIHDPQILEPINKLRIKEKNPDVVHYYNLAMARLRDSEARKRITLKLNSSKSKALAQVIRDYSYINDISTLQDLKPFLDKLDPLINARPSHSKTKVWLRSCDIAAAVIIEVANLPIAKELIDLELKPFSKEQIDKVRAYLNHQQ